MKNIAIAALVAASVGLTGIASASAATTPTKTSPVVKADAKKSEWLRSSTEAKKQEWLRSATAEWLR